MEPIFSICIFQIGDNYFGIDLGQITKITGRVKIESAKTSNSPNMIGMACIDNETMPVIDLNKILNITSIAIQNNTLFLIIEAKNSRVCFPVSNIIGHYEVEYDNLTPVPAVIQDRYTHYFTGVAALDSKLVLIMDPAAIQ